MKTSHDELRDLLHDATTSDLDRVLHALDRWPRPTRAAVTFALARVNDDGRDALESDLAEEIVRCASAPMSRAARRVLRRPARDDLHDVVTVCAKRLGVGVRVPIGGTLRGRLAAMSGALVDRAVREMSAETQQRLGIDAIDRLEPRSNAAELAGAAALPALHAALGSAALASVVEGIVIQGVAVVVGRHVARAAVSAAAARVPAAALGPVAWGAGGLMLAWELQKPALRKLLPAFVALGFVAMRG